VNEASADPAPWRTALGRASAELDAMLAYLRDTEGDPLRPEARRRVRDAIADLRRVRREGWERVREMAHQ
jgi:hypothetical protein